MALQDNGFIYPEINEEKCLECGLCKKVCPVLNLKKEEESLPDCYACFNKNEQIRMESSSGGMFSLIAEKIIDKRWSCFWSGI